MMPVQANNRHLSKHFNNPAIKVKVGGISKKKRPSRIVRFVSSGPMVCHHDISADDSSALFIKPDMIALRSWSASASASDRW
jgi:hypothetical protein